MSAVADFLEFFSYSEVFTTCSTLGLVADSLEFLIWEVLLHVLGGDVSTLTCSKKRRLICLIPLALARLHQQHSDNFATQRRYSDTPLSLVRGGRIAYTHYLIRQT